MIRSTFIHIPCIGNATERKIWANNILTWNDFLNNQRKIPLSFGKIREIKEMLIESEKALSSSNHTFFSKRMANKEHWRAYHHFKTCYLDIETTGLDKKRDDITIIGLYNGEESKLFVKGYNLSDFSEEIKKYQCIVSFNGSCFDVPFILNKFPDLNIDQFHIDLRFATRNIGLIGGLKAIENKIGINRDENIIDIDGYEAVRLWRKYERGDKKALETLCNYNKADIENLKILMEYTFNNLKNICFKKELNNLNFKNN
jgi:uncharacterized protein